MVRPTTSSVPKRRRASDWVMIAELTCDKRVCVAAHQRQRHHAQEVAVDPEIVLGRRRLAVLEEDRIGVGDIDLALDLREICL